MEIKKQRGHAPEKVLRNQIIIALYICGFSQWEISRTLKVDRRNIQHFIQKYRPKYLRTTFHNIAEVISNLVLREKSKK